MITSHNYNDKIKYVVERSKKISGLRITVGAERGAVVTAPVNCNSRYIDAFVGEKARWIKDRLQHLEKQVGCRVPREFVSSEKLFYLGGKYTLLVKGTTGHNMCLK